ncbi:hypothetical protein MBANPS3_011655 [Mucor bainieri]
MTEFDMNAVDTSEVTMWHYTSLIAGTSSAKMTEVATSSYLYIKHNRFDHTHYEINKRAQVQKISNNYDIGTKLITESYEVNRSFRIRESTQISVITFLGEDRQNPDGVIDYANQHRQLKHIENCKWLSSKGEILESVCSSAWM